ASASGSNRGAERRPAARIRRPLRHNGTPCAGINILMLWGASVEHGFTSPGWMTFRQALALNAHVRKGEKGSLVVYANTFTRTEEDAEGREIDREIPFLKGHTVFYVEQIEGLPEHYYAKTFAVAVAEPATRRKPTTSRCRPSRVSVTLKAFCVTLAHQTSVPAQS
ncbi:MAG: ArdC-like ssDNA-binding domain-containing protein, partial [Acidobacteriota bacterium]